MVAQEPPLPLERYAELSAAIDARRARDAVLAEAGIEVGAWLIVQHYWLSRFGVEANARRFETAKAFQRSYVEHRGRLAASGVGTQLTRAPVLSQTAPTSATGERPGPRLEAQAPLHAGLGARGGAEGPRLTLAQWASLSVELATWPAVVGDTLRRYGFDEASHAREAREWQWRLAEDVGLAERFGALFSQYRDWLLGGAATRPK